MADINGAFPSNYLKAADLQGRSLRVQIESMKMEDVGDDHKPVLYFQGKTKGLVLNKTNAMTIADAYGPETDAWNGAEIELFAQKVEFQGRRVDGLRVRLPSAAPARQARAPAPAPQNGPEPPARGGALDEDIPFAPCRD